MLICTRSYFIFQKHIYLLLSLMLTQTSLQIVPATAIPDDWMGLDVGSDSTKTFNEALDTTQPIIWNGPMGVFEFEKFAADTEVNCQVFPFRNPTVHPVPVPGSVAGTYRT